ncbi:unnamed protein product [Closterium sp. NIES-54]
MPDVSGGGVDERDYIVVCSLSAFADVLYVAVDLLQWCICWRARGVVIYKRLMRYVGFRTELVIGASAVVVASASANVADATVVCAAADVVDAAIV